MIKTSYGKHGLFMLPSDNIQVNTLYYLVMLKGVDINLWASHPRLQQFSLHILRYV
jgi:hypothetical protein